MKNKRIDMEKLALLAATKEIIKKYNGKMIPFEHEKNHLIAIDTDKFVMALTICDTDKRRCIKIEEILVNEGFRNLGIATDVLKTFMKYAKELNVAVGLWCKKENKIGYEFYKKLGFNHVDTINDYWFEYN